MRSASFSRPATRQSFSRRMLLVLLPFVLVPVLILGSLIYFRTRGVIQDQISLIISEIGHSQSSQIDNWFSKLENKLSLTARRPGIVSAYGSLITEDAMERSIPSAVRESIAAELETVNQGELLFNQFIMTSPAGEVLLASERGWEGYELGDKDYFQALSSEGGSLIAVSPSPLFRSTVVSFTGIPVFDEQDTLIGHLIGVTGGSSLQRILESVGAFHPEARAYLVSLDGHFIGIDPSISSMVKLAGMTPANEQASAVQGVIDQGLSSGILSFNSFDDQPALASFHRLEQVSNLLAIELPQENVLGGLTNLSAFLAVAFLLAAVVLGLLIWGGTRNALRPMIALTEAISDFKLGESFRLVEVVREDEIGLLSETYNQMAGELSSFYESLEEKVDSRSRQIRTAAEIAQLATGATEVDEILQQTVELIVERFGYYHAAVYVLDSPHKYAILKNASGTAAVELLTRGHRLAVGSNSIVGWVTSANKSRVTGDLLKDPLYYQNELLPLTRSEAGIPISARGEILGALDVQSSDPNAFDPETVASLQILAELIASAILNVRVMETTAIDLRELSRLYQAGRNLASAKSMEDVNRIISESLSVSSYSNAYYVAQQNGFSLFSFNNTGEVLGESEGPGPESWLPTPPANLITPLLDETGVIHLDTLSEDRYFKDFQNLAIRLGWGSLALLPMVVDNEVTALLIIASKSRNQISEQITAPFAELIEMARLSIKNIFLIQSTQAQQENLDTVGALLQGFANVDPADEFDLLLSTLLDKLRDMFGGERAAIYMTIPEKNLVELRVSAGFMESEPFQTTILPLEEGAVGEAVSQLETVTQVVNHESGVPNQDTQTNGKYAITAIPIVYRNKALGALTIEVIQTRSLSPTDIELVQAVCSSLALMIANERLIDRQRTLYEVTSRISHSAGMADVMRTTVHELSELLGARRARLRIGSLPSQEPSNRGTGPLDLHTHGS